LCAFKYVAMTVSVHVTGVVPGCYRACCPGSASVAARRAARSHLEAEREVGGAAGWRAAGRGGYPARRVREAADGRPAAGKRRAEKAPRLCVSA
jgi:hypothetical protein